MPGVGLGARATAACSAPRLVEPQPSLMLMPSGSTPIAITSAPASASSRGASAYAAPCAQSTTIRQPASGWAAPVVAAHRRQQVRQVALGLAGRVRDPAEASLRNPLARAVSGLRGSRGHPGLDLGLDLVGKLDSAPGEELDPVVRRRVVAGRQHHAEVGVEDVGEVGNGRRRDDAEPQHVDAALGESRRPPRPQGTHQRHAGHGRRPRPAEDARTMTARTTAAGRRPAEDVRAAAESQAGGKPGVEIEPGARRARRQCRIAP